MLGRILFVCATVPVYRPIDDMNLKVEKSEGSFKRHALSYMNGGDKRRTRAYTGATRIFPLRETVLGTVTVISAESTVERF